MNKYVVTLGTRDHRYFIIRGDSPAEAVVLAKEVVYSDGDHRPQYVVEVEQLDTHELLHDFPEGPIDQLDLKLKEMEERLTLIRELTK